MAKTSQPQRRDDIARRWQRLAERRRDHLLELYRTGRWRRYYSEDQLMAEMREAVREIRAWEAIGKATTAQPNREAMRPGGDPAPSAPSPEPQRR